MSEKFKKIVNEPHRAFGRARRAISKTHPESKVGKTARVTGVMATGVFQFLLWATKYAVLDNHVTRAMEKGFANKKNNSFVKQHPNLSAHMLYYMMMAATLGVAHEYSQSNDDDNDDKNKIENVIPGYGNDVVISDNTYGSFVKKMEPLIDPFIAYLILPEDLHKNTKGLHTPYDSKDGKITIGYGSTKTPDGNPVTKRTPPITDDQAREWVRQHLYTETFPLMYAYSVMYPDVKLDTPQDALFIMSALYNAASQLIEIGGSRTFDMTNLVKKRGDNFTAQDVMNLFAQKPVQKLTGFGKLWAKNAPVKDLDKELVKWVWSNGKIARGLYVRRFVELGVGLGQLTPLQCLDFSAGLIYEYGKAVDYNDKHAFFDKNGNVNLGTYKKLIKYISDNTSQQTKIRNFLSEQMVQNIESGKSYKEFEMLASEYKSTYVNVVSVMTQLQYDAQSAFDDGDFEQAAQLFERLTQEYPNVAAYHNDLAATYNKLGRYDDAIAQVRVILDEIGDTEQYGAAYYNAGQARERLGQPDKALANYRLAVKHGNRRVQKDVTRLSPEPKKAKPKSVPKKRNVSTKKKVKSKKTAFNNATKKLGNNAHSADFDVSKLMRDGYDMA